jgi:hypothetical protein
MEIKGTFTGTAFEGTDKLSGLKKFKSKRVKFENIAIGANSSQTLLNTTGAGTITTIWMTMNSQDRTSKLKIWFDGETNPSIDVDLATLFLSNFCDGTSGTKFQWSTQNIHGEGGQINSQGGYITFPMPYKNGCIVQIVTTTAIGQFYAMVDYVPGMTNEYRLKSLSRSLSENPQTFLSTDSLDLWQTPTGAEGWMVYLAYVGQGTGSSFLERNFEFYIDGEGTASHISSGTEDTFFGSYYWQGKQTYSFPQTAVSYFQEVGGSSKSATAVDMLATNGMGLYFSSNLRLRLPTEAAVSVGHTAGHFTLFYTTENSSWVNPVTTTTTTSTTTTSSTTTTTVAGTVKVLDTFTAANTTNGLPSHTPDTNVPGGSWTTVNSPIFGILNNKAYVSSMNSTESYCVIEGSATDGTLECDMTTGTGPDRTVRGLVFRYASTGSFMKLVLVKVAGVNQLELRSQGTLYATITSTPLADATTYAVKIVMSGNTVTVYLNGTQVGQTTSASGFTGTKIGFMLYTSGTGNDDLTGTWDNFKFTV